MNCKTCNTQVIDTYTILNPIMVEKGFIIRMYYCNECDIYIGKKIEG